jgi:hypothetical protein
MRGFFRGLFSRPTLASLDGTLTRDRIIQGGRLAFIDDESLLLIDELRQSGFSVDHDKTGDDLHNYDMQIYDVAIVDYHGVGRRLGLAQGLALVKHIRRVSPRTRVIAYTSRSLTASESEFFRLSHVVLPKDFGLVDSLMLIEGELRKALSKEHLFEALIVQLSLTHGDQRDRIRDELVSALSKKNESRFKHFLTDAVGAAAVKGVEIVLGKLFIS